LNHCTRALAIPHALIAFSLLFPCPLIPFSFFNPSLVTSQEWERCYIITKCRAIVRAGTATTPHHELFSALRERIDRDQPFPSMAVFVEEGKKQRDVVVISNYVIGRMSQSNFEEMMEYIM